MSELRSNQEIGAEIRRIRGSRSEKQEEFAAAVGMPGAQSDISKWERGEKRPGAETLKVIARLGGVSVSTFYQEVDSNVAGPITADEALAGIISLVDRYRAGRGSILPGGKAARAVPGRPTEKRREQFGPTQSEQDSEEKAGGDDHGT